MNPTESTFLTSSYVSVPPMDTSPLKVADVAEIVVPEIAPEKDPLKLDAVMIPYELIFLVTISSVLLRVTFPVRP